VADETPFELNDALSVRTWVYAVSAGATQVDPKLEPAVRDQRVEQYAARTLAILNQFRAAGCFKTPDYLDDLKQNSSFDSLRKRDDFKQFLADLDRNGDAPPGP
jgi:hypothetical protein